jgi:hypothetical protein
MWVYYFAYTLSLFRLPFALIPYLIKLCLFLSLKDSFSGFWHKYFVQLIRVFGDFVNFFLFVALFLKFHGMWDSWILRTILVLSITAEAFRLITEKGTTILSAFWQLLPHRSIAERLHGKSNSHVLKIYCRYYILSDQERLWKTLHRLRALARLSNNAQAVSKLKYVNSFKIVPDSTDLRAGEIRNVALGEIYAHASWTSNPDLLRGLALRRSPWIFDPRFLRRPFYYRTEANRMMTNFVFENFRLCPLFAVYQLGHEIKSARYDAFFRVIRWFGYELEEPVQANGTYKFDPLARTLLENHLKLSTKNSRSLWTDDEVIKDLKGCVIPPALEIAKRYTYPLIYIQEVLLPKILAYENNS